ncbi:MAG: hypothetical protein HFF05_06335 [Oscillospiraceae bacterium]|nr:hypothetical protein [Oscillospiraceae bacterium]MCI8761470.1 hypothetical protein [Oscillospiraceae bacterium]
MSQPDPTLKELSKDPKAAQLLGDTAALKSLLASPETQKLVSLLNQKGGGGLQAAAKAAAKGQPDALMGILNQVMASPEGAQAAEAFQKKTQQ